MTPEHVAARPSRRRPGLSRWAGAWVLACAGTLLLAGCGGKQEEPAPGPSDADMGGMAPGPDMPPEPGGDPGMAPEPGMSAEPGMGGEPGMGEPGGDAFDEGGGFGDEAEPGAAAAAAPPAVAPFASRPDPFRPLDRPTELEPVIPEAEVVARRFQGVRPGVVAPPQREPDRGPGREVPTGLRMAGILHGPTVRAILEQGDQTWRVQPGDTVEVELQGDRVRLTVSAISPRGVTLRAPTTGREYFAPYAEQ